MSFSKLKRLLTARKAWRLFAAKLQTKFYRSKAIKKNRPQQLSITTTIRSKPLFWSALSLQSRLKLKRRITKPPHHQRYRLHKRPTPVYIDQLFTEPESVLKERPQPAAASKGAKKVGMGDGNNGTSHAADDMWESLALASPQMYGINERAEEFITRFRAEMQFQESLARRL